MALLRVGLRVADRGSQGQVMAEQQQK